MSLSDKTTRPDLVDPTPDGPGAPDLAPAAGLAVLAGIPGPDLADAVARALGRRVRRSGVTSRGGAADGPVTVSWGELNGPADGGDPVLLVGAARFGDRDMVPGDVAGLLQDGRATGRRAANVSPTLGAVTGTSVPFAAAVRRGDRVAVQTDALGFRQVYVLEGADPTGVATSVVPLALASGAGLDPEALAVQSCLGWQVGERTPFARIRVLGAGESVELSDGRLVRHPVPATPRPERGRLELMTAARVAARLLRTSVNAFLDEHPDAVLQLTGGQDSRLLLGAVAPTRRSQVEAMTLAVPGSADVTIAAQIAARHGMRHRIVTLEGIGAIEPAAAWELCRQAALRLDCSADPLAAASLAFAEQQMPPGPRLSGLGGEFARGFYYAGPGGDQPVTRERVEQLAQWRLFPNESVASGVLAEEFASWSRTRALDAIEAALTVPGLSWCDATDEFYLGQRMRRWAGLLATAGCFDRLVVNPMLDARFLALARQVAPADKRSMRYLSRIMVELDPDLAALRMDGRPAPAVYAQPGARRAVALAGVQARRVSGKVRQRLVGARRPPAGAQVLAGLLVEHWRTHPETVAGLDRTGLVSADWLGGLLDRTHGADASTVAFLVNLVVAESLTGSPDPRHATRPGAVPEGQRTADRSSSQ